MKILFVVKALGAVRGGAEKVLCEVAGALSGRGHTVDLVSFDLPTSEPLYPLDPSIAFTPLGTHPADRPTGLSDLAGKTATLRRCLKTAKPDVAVGFMHSAFIPLAFAAIGSGVPVVASEHIVPEHYRSRRAEFTLLIFAGLLSARMTVVSEQVKALYPRLLRGRILALPNPVVLPPTQNDAATHESKTILCIGRLDPQKDHRTLIEAFAKISPAFPEWRLRMIGSGPLEAQVREHLARTRLGERISLTASVADTSPCYRESAFLVLPSLYESFGLVAAESLAHGRPVLAFADCPGVNVLVRDRKNGLLVEGRDRVAALAEGMGKLMGDAELRARLGVEGPASVADYRLETIIGKWEKMLLEVSGTDS